MDWRNPQYMQIKPLKAKFKRYLVAHQLEKKFNKQVALFQQDPSYPSLKTELLKPQSERIYSFRIDRKYRVIFIFISPDEIEIIDINDHYQ